MAGRAMGAGLYYFEAIKDPEVAAAGQKRFIEWQERWRAVMEAKESYGWGSKEAQMAIIEYKEWQLSNKRSDQLDQDPCDGYSVI